MLAQFERVVAEANPTWFLFENVVEAPSVSVSGFVEQRFSLDLAWLSDFPRRRDFIFESRTGQILNPIVSTKRQSKGTAVHSSDERSFAACCEIQGLPGDFDITFSRCQESVRPWRMASPFTWGAISQT
jgi:DNA (cytosine-5)-methyltransferase 1